ncbi:MAG: SCO family protein [Candidatus Binatia bacterium]
MTAPRGLPLFFALTLSLWLSVVSLAHAHDESRPIPLRDVEFDQKLDSQIPLDLSFTDERGVPVQLRQYLGGKPIILNFVYYKCRDLCPLLLDGIVRALRAISFDVGDEFEVLTVSIDPSDTAALAAAQKKDFIGRYGRPGAEHGWHFLTGEESTIRKLAEAVGFHYSFNAKTGEFAHATGIVLLTPAGKASRYFYGIEFSPRDLRLGLVEAAEGKIGTPIDQLLLFCYHYDPVTGKYGPFVTNLVRMAGLITVITLGGFILWMLRRERAHAGAAGRPA